MRFEYFHILRIFNSILHLQSILKIFTSTSNIFNCKLHLTYIRNNCCSITQVILLHDCVIFIFSTLHCIQLSICFASLPETRSSALTISCSDCCSTQGLLHARLSTPTGVLTSRLLNIQLNFFTSRTIQYYSCDTLRVRAFTCATYLFQASNKVYITNIQYNKFINVFRFKHTQCYTTPSITYITTKQITGSILCTVLF